MNLKELGKIIFEPSSDFMRNLGKKLFEDGLVSNVKGKKIEHYYHIYGDISNGVTKSGFKTHIKINLLKKKLEGTWCTCSTFKDNSSSKTTFMCEHLTAVAYEFLSLLYKTQSEKNALLKKNHKKIKVTIDVNIICKWWKGKTNYELEFRIGYEHKFLITDLKSFISNLDKEKIIYFNNQFTYNPKTYYIAPEYEKIINFIRVQVYENKALSPTGRSIIVIPNDLREFLQCIDGQKIKFKYNAIEYNINIFKEDLPYSFTLKEKDEQFILTTHKRLPIPLNSNNDVYFFNDQIYLPPISQLKKYKYLYEKFKKQREILYRKTEENYNKIILLLSSISNDISLSEGVKKFGVDLLRFNFLIYKEEENIYCEVQGTYHNRKVNILEEKDGKSQAIRQLNKEQQVLMKLEYYNFIKKNHRLMFVGNDEDIFNLLNNREKHIHQLGNIILGKGLEDLRIYNSSSINVDLCEENQLFKFSYNIGDIKGEEFFNIFESYKEDNRFYKTKDNVFIDFEDEGVRDFFNLIEVLHISENLTDGCANIEKNKVFYAVQRLKSRDFNLSDEFLNAIEDILIDIKDAEVTLPKKLDAVLREYQISGFKWFNNLNKLQFGGILADEMGLGKTVQTIAFLSSQEDKKTLIIAPTSLIYNWKEEVEKFAPTLKILIAHGGGDVYKDIGDKLKNHHMILTSYATLRNNIEKYSDVEFDYCIIDEAQNIKNPKAKITKAVKEINAKIRFALTGTPIENNLTELWSIFDFIMPGYLYSKEVFDKKFGYNGDCDLENLKLLIKPFILRRTKKEVVTDLEDKIEKKILVEMTAPQKAVYNTYINDIKLKMKNNSGAKIEILSYLTRLRQICLDPSIVISDYKGGSGKIKTAMHLVQRQIDHKGKMLIFSQFTSALNKIGEALKERNIEYFSLDGSTPSKERIRLVNEFNDSNKTLVFLISLKAGGTGLNLTSANLVIHFDPWWNPAVEHQASDRAHRIGQKNVVEVIKLVAKGTIEEKIILLQERKKELIDTVITGELKSSNVLNKLTKEELMELFFHS